MKVMEEGEVSKEVYDGGNELMFDAVNLGGYSDVRCHGEEVYMKSQLYRDVEERMKKLGEEMAVYDRILCLLRSREVKECIRMLKERGFI